MIKELAKYVKQYKKYAILTPFMVVLEIVMEVVIPYLMARIIDIGIQNNDLDYIIRIGIMLVISAIMSLIFGVLSGRFAAVASSGFAKNLRQGMFYNIQNYSFSNIDKFSTSSLVTRLTTDVTNVQMAFQMIIRALVRGPVMIVFALIMAFSINKELSLVYVVTMVPLAILLAFISIKAHPYFEKVFKKYDELNRVVGENLNAIRVVKSFATEDLEEKKFEDVNSLVYKLFKKAEKIVLFNSPLMQLAIYGCILLLSWLGAQTIVLSSLMMLSMVLVMIIISESSAERIVEVLTENPTIKNKEKTVKEIKDGSIEFIDVDFQYDDAKANEMLPLEDINLKINSGEVIGIIGGTGSSKTSLVNLIPRLYDVKSGFVKVGGVDVRDYDLETLRNGVAMVLQKNVLFSGTIAENLRWGNEQATDEELVEACKLAQADSFIQELPDKYETVLDQGGTNVSGGQKQRICIARALLKKPKILILDDSTSAVDTKTDALIRKAFKEDIPDTTKIIIAQRISSIIDADKIIVMDNGRIDGIGTSDELLKTNKIYQEVYESQMGGDDAKDEKEN